MRFRSKTVDCHNDTGCGFQSILKCKEHCINTDNAETIFSDKISISVWYRTSLVASTALKDVYLGLENV